MIRSLYRFIQHVHFSLLRAAQQSSCSYRGDPILVDCICYLFIIREGFGSFRSLCAQRGMARWRRVILHNVKAFVDRYNELFKISKYVA